MSLDSDNHQDYCFIIQPFDEGPFDKRFDEILEPTVKSFGLFPYRVDRDHSSSIPILDIEKKIKDSRICLADISTDNPNVWLELGMAISHKKQIILLCLSNARSKYPFDIQHRKIISYRNDSVSDFNKLKSEIEEAIKARLRADVRIEQIIETPLIENHGLKPHEIMGLVSIMQNRHTHNDGVGKHTIATDFKKAGFNDFAINNALTKLLRKKLIILREVGDVYDNTYFEYALTEDGEDWLIDNEDKFNLKDSSEKDFSDEPF